jgi:cathepsin X
VDANPLLNYTGGIISTPGKGVDHIVSVIGWGKDDKSGKSYWLSESRAARTCRNS